MGGRSTHHVTPLFVMAGRQRHRRHLKAMVLGLALGLALVLIALVTSSGPVFWAGYLLAAATWFGGQSWCRRHGCRPPRRKG
jgi:hypothetical protein